MFEMQRREPRKNEPGKEYRFKDRLEQLIFEKRMLPSKVAKAAGVSEPHVTRWLRGTCLPTYKEIHHLCKIFDVKPNSFFWLEDE